MLAGIEPLVETAFIDDAEVVVVAFGTPGKFVRVRGARSCGPRARIGYVRPITLLPFPTDAVADARPTARARSQSTRTTRARWSTTSASRCSGRAPVDFIGGLSLDSSGFGVAPDLDVG